MTLPPHECERIHSGESPLKVWREYKGLDLYELRTETGIRVERLEKIDQGKGRPITREEAVKLGRAMDIPAIELMPHGWAFRSCSGVELSEE